jgi:hypothetical protein
MSPKVFTGSVSLKSATRPTAGVGLRRIEEPGFIRIQFDARRAGPERGP